MLELLHRAEGSWWYRGRAAVVAAVTAKFPRAESALDYGAGYGGMCAFLRTRSTHVYAYEPDPDARAIATTRGYDAVYSDADVTLSHVYDLAVMFDVIEHIEDDRAFLSRLHTVLSAGGTVVVTVPAFQWLWSEHDTKNMHHRRYTRALLVARLRDAGFKVSYAGYWNMTLFPIAALVRLSGRSGADALETNSIVNAILYGIVLIEAAVARYLPLPFGLSVIAVASKS